MNGKKFKYALIMMLLFSTILGACQPQALTEQPTEANKQPTETAAAVEQTAITGEVVEITYMRQAEAHPIDLEFVEEFNATHPNIRVIVDNTPAGETYSKLALTTESGNPPDVYMTYWTSGAASNGLAYDLTPFLEREGPDFFNAYYEAAWTFNEYGGKYYGVPYRIAPVSVIVNKNMFEKAGIPLPPNDWTWEDFLETAKKLTNKEKGEYGWCLTGSAESPGTDAQFYPFLFSAGGKMINSEGYAGFNSKEGVEALQWMVDAVQSGEAIPPGTTSASNNTCVDMLAADKVAMWIDASLWLGFIRTPRPEVNITLATMPIGKIASTDNGGTGLGMASKTKHPEEAWEFLKYLISDDVMKRWGMAASFVPGNKAVLADPEFLADSENSTVVYMLDNYKIWPLSHYPDNANLEGILRTYLQAAYLGEMTPQEALDGAAEEWNAILETYRADEWWTLWK